MTCDPDASESASTAQTHPVTGGQLQEPARDPGNDSAAILRDPPRHRPVLERTLSGVIITLSQEWAVLDECLTITTTDGAGFDGIIIAIGENCTIGVGR